MANYLGNIEKIVFFIFVPFNKRDEKRFGIETLLKNGFEVEVWDFTPLLRPHMHKKANPDKDDFKNLRPISTKKEAISAISKLPDRSMIACLINYEFKHYFIFRAISKRRIPYFFLFYNFPSFVIGKKKSILRKIFNIRLYALINFFFVRFPYGLVGISPANIVLIAGKKIGIPREPWDKNTDIIQIPYFDYDVYLEEKGRPMKVNGKMGVFLDGCGPFHPDFMKNSLFPPEKYYSLLCDFFDYVEKSLGTRVVIAAHPRSNYSVDCDYFKGREIVKERTAELVKESDFVILHESAAVSFAVLFNKPLIFTTTDELKGSLAGQVTYFMAEFFGKEPINLSSAGNIDLKKQLFINKEAYKKYRNEYIIHEGTEELPIWQIFVNHLKNAQS